METVVLKNGIGETYFRRLKLWICVVVPLFFAGLLFAIVQAIHSGDMWLLATGIFGILFIPFVCTLLYQAFGRTADTIVFAGDIVTFTLCNQKEIPLPRCAVKEVNADWARYQFVYFDARGSRKVLWMYRRKWYWSKPLMDETVLKRELYGAAVSGM